MTSIATSTSITRIWAAGIAGALIFFALLVAPAPAATLGEFCVFQKYDPARSTRWRCTAARYEDSAGLGSFGDAAGWFNGPCFSTMTEARAALSTLPECAPDFATAPAPPPLPAVWCVLFQSSLDSQGRPVRRGTAILEKDIAGAGMGWNLVSCSMTFTAAQALVTAINTGASSSPPPKPLPPVAVNPPHQPPHLPPAPLPPVTLNQPPPHQPPAPLPPVTLPVPQTQPAKQAEPAKQADPKAHEPKVAAVDPDDDPPAPKLHEPKVGDTAAPPVSKPRPRQRASGGGIDPGTAIAIGAIGGAILQGVLQGGRRHGGGGGGGAPAPKRH